MDIDALKLKRMQFLHVAFILLDVRDKLKYEEKHIPGALHLAAAEFLEKIGGMVPDKSTPIVIYSSDGRVASELALGAEKIGFVNIVNLEGGFLSYFNSSNG